MWNLRRTQLKKLRAKPLIQTCNTPIPRLPRKRSSILMIRSASMMPWYAQAPPMSSFSSPPSMPLLASHFCNRSQTSSRRPTRIHQLPSSKSSSSTAIALRNNTRLALVRWIQSGSPFHLSPKLSLRKSKTWLKLQTSHVSRSSTPLNRSMRCKSKISNQSFWEIRVASRLSEMLWIDSLHEKTLIM